MSADLSCDVLVVGLGPAGASAATVAARLGARVIGFDRKRQAGFPVQCAEFVPPLCGAAPEVVASARRQDISSMRTMIESAEPFASPDFRGLMIDRATFDAALVAEAEAAGAQLRFGALARTIEPDGAIRFSDGTRIAASVIVGADGPRSLLGQAIGSANRELVETRQATVPLLSDYAATDIFLSADYPGGYGWLFPKRDRAHVGIGLAPGSRHRLKPLLDSLLARLIAQGRVGSNVLAMTGGPIPAGGMVTPHGEIGRALVLLAGDAAGLANPVTGAGISAAVQSGQLAGEAALRRLGGDAEAGSRYRDDLTDLFGPPLARALRRRREVLAACQASSIPSASALSRGWIAFPEYWAT